MESFPCDAPENRAINPYKNKVHFSPHGMGALPGTGDVMKQSMTSAWKNSVAAASLAVMSLVPATALSQASGPVAANTNKPKAETVANKEPVVQIKDLRKGTPEDAARFTHHKSREGWVIVLVSGCEQHVIDAVKGSIKGLMWTGRTQIGMVIGNRTDQKGDDPQIIVVSHKDGKPTYSRIMNPSGTGQTKNLVEDFVREVYDRDIGKPKQATASASLQPSPQEP